MAEHEDHGNTPAAWTTVITIIVGFTIGSAGLLFDSIPTIVVGAVICILGVVAGKVMSMAGMGKPAEAAAPGDAEQTQAA